MRTAFFGAMTAVAVAIRATSPTIVLRSKATLRAAWATDWTASLVREKRPV